MYCHVKSVVFVEVETPRIQNKAATLLLKQSIKTRQITAGLPQLRPAGTNGATETPYQSIHYLKHDCQYWLSPA